VTGENSKRRAITAASILPMAGLVGEWAWRPWGGIVYLFYLGCVQSVAQAFAERGKRIRRWKNGKIKRKFAFTPGLYD
jgi:hypothetical protein